MQLSKVNNLYPRETYIFKGSAPIFEILLEASFSEIVENQKVNTKESEN